MRNFQAIVALSVTLCAIGCDAQSEPKLNDSVPKTRTQGSPQIEIRDFGAGYVEIRENEVDMAVTFTARNITNEPLRLASVNISCSYEGQPELNIVIPKEVKNELFSLGALTEGVLLPGHISKPVRLVFTTDHDHWRTNQTVTVQPAEVKKVEYSPDSTDPQLFGVFIAAATYEQVREAIRKHPESLKLKNIRGMTMLHFALLQHDIRIPKELEKAGLDIHAKTNSGQNALHMAAFSTPEMVAYVASRRVKAELTTMNGYSPLTYAVTLGNHAVIKPLIDAGVSLEASDKNGNTALHVAIGHGQPEIAKMLVQLGAKTRAFNKFGMSPLGIAMTFPSLPMLDKIYKLDSDLNARASNGMTPAHIAVRQRNRWAARWLIEKGARFDIRDNEGKLPEDHYKGSNTPAVEQEWKEIFRLARQNRKR